MFAGQEGSLTLRSLYANPQGIQQYSPNLQVDRPYTALNSETYITIREQELRKCKRIGYEFYCGELFVVKHV